MSKDLDLTDPENVIKWKEDRYIYTAQQAGIERVKLLKQADRIAKAMRLLRAWECLPWGAQGNVAHMRDLLSTMEGKSITYKMLRVEQNERIRERLEQALQDAGSCNCKEPDVKCRCCNAWLALAWVEDALSADKDEDPH